MKVLTSFYLGVVRCQFSTRHPTELGQNRSTIFSHLQLEPTYEFFALEELAEVDYQLRVSDFKSGPFLKALSEELAVDFYHPTWAADGKRIRGKELHLKLESHVEFVGSKEWFWEELNFDKIPPKFLHECFLAYHPNSNHGRIGGLALLKQVRYFDEHGNECSHPNAGVNSIVHRGAKRGCLSTAGDWVSRVYRFNLWFRDWFNAWFLRLFGARFFGIEGSGCAPSLLPTGCSGPGCQRFGCGLFGVVAAFALLLWLLRCIVFGDCGDSQANGERVVERVIHDTVYVEKNSRVDTLTYLDETTKTTVKVLTLPNVQFEKGKAKLLRSSIPQLNELAAYLIENAEVQAEIIGHTDGDGEAEANRVLSQERAQSVLDYLVGNGVEGGRLTATGKGETDPVANNTTAEGRAMNRRVEVKLSQNSSSTTTRTQGERILLE